MMITNVRDTGRPTALEDGEMMFHYDQCYYERPSMGSTLYAIEVPDEGGNTLFSNCRMAWEALSDAWKQRLDGLRALNYYDYGRNPTVRPETIDPDKPHWVHPVVRTHPETGRKALYVSRRFTIGIEGMDDAEAQPLLDALFEHQLRPDLIYRHQYRLHDLIMWDNRCTTHHAAGGIPPGQIRHMHRTTLAGDVPV
jgi:taurine dioxygenase